MKFRCKTDKWRQYRGYVFAFGKPTEVTDRASIEALKNHADFETVQDIEHYSAPNSPLTVVNVSRETLTLPKKRGRPPKNEAVL